jgi:homoserine kinase
MTQSFEVRVPCSSANLGPGFDCLGIALTLYLTVQCTVVDHDTMEIEIKRVSDGLSMDPSENLLTQMIYNIADRFKSKATKKVSLEIMSDIPLKFASSI